MDDFKIKIDEDLIQYQIKKNNVDEFINTLIRERMKAENVNSISNMDSAYSWPRQKSHTSLHR
jgi:hypothetical protein